MGLFVSVESGLIVGTLCHSIILVFYSSRHTAIFLCFRGFNKNNFFSQKLALIAGLVGSTALTYQDGSKIFYGKVTCRHHRIILKTLFLDFSETRR
jgi:hypothetical protein